MFKTYNVADSFGQMNLFMTLQVYRNLSNMSYLAAADSAEDDQEEEPKQDSSPKSRNRDKPV